ncbi:hypothetical protein ASPZODRAFT_97429 [Penicilliopsis zonata CBS 506.65]|uniref:Rhodopsin domain-containing protein n=1 Tax=Penicilliopsis zonata CBS 506.65 TaxID=1073090 RepID=A0A1L9SG39_9EURO|nr:hypothetical protein ASPZODRAFT_97429 [Penicilliopsis zonata CBS 506.65]OJJ45994.1 hypothetical protein ASPZODRAFT_97429 [Penicilliopsis zonata CBS 506.65]
MAVLHTINLITQCLCFPIITLFVALRLWVRIRLQQGLAAEDYTCLIGWALFMGYCAVSLYVGEYGGGYPYSEVSEANLVLFRKFCYAATLFYCPMAFFVKVALLSILTRIFSPYRSKVLFIYIFLAVLCSYYIAALIIKIRMCLPIPTYWLGTGGHCLDQQAALIADSVISVVSDLIILLLPLPLTWSLQMSRNRKLRVMGILGAGGLATAFSLYRLVLVLQDGSSPDQTIIFTKVILSGNAEGGVGLICTCLPTFNHLLNHFCHNGFSTSKKYASSGYPMGHYGENTTVVEAEIGLEREGDQTVLIKESELYQGIQRTVEVQQWVSHH